MSRDVMKARMKQLSGWALERWGIATNDPWLRIAGRRQQLLGKLEANLAQSRNIVKGMTVEKKK